MPLAVAELRKAQQALAHHYVATGLKFTLDGRLVGDIAEALAFEHFDLVPPARRTGGVDALTRNNRTVQVKCTGKRECGPAFSRGKVGAEFLLFFYLDFEANSATVIYNGPEAPVRVHLPEEWSGTCSVPLSKMRELERQVPEGQRLPLAVRACA